WCYLVWYGVTIVRYFDPSPRLWLNSIGISAVIGLSLYLSTAYDGGVRRQLGRWQIFRLFLTPFCVSSFAALIKDQGFVLVFDGRLGGNLWAIVACLLFLALVWFARKVAAGSTSLPAGH